MKKLMKRYERVELQYNVDNVRKDLKFKYEDLSKNKLLNTISRRDSPLDQMIKKDYI